MFRRFMIVCWVLFSLGAVTGLVGFAGYQYYDPKVEETAETTTLPSGGGITWYDRELQDKRDIFEGIMVVGFVPAGIILLWNILIYTIRWIWQGRKVEKKSNGSET